MKEKENDKVELFEGLKDTYKAHGLPLDHIDTESEFVIHNLADVHAQLPFKSKIFRTNYFSFVFVKDARGKYSTDEQLFETRPGTIYFTNPGHYKSFEWF